MYLNTHDLNGRGKTRLTRILFKSPLIIFYMLFIVDIIIIFGQVFYTCTHPKPMFFCCSLPRKGLLTRHHKQSFGLCGH